MKNYINLANGISWKNKLLVDEVLSKNSDLDLLFDKGTFFIMSIENGSCEIVKSLLDYFNNYQLAKYTSGSTEYLLLKNKLRSTLETAIEDVDLSQGMKEELSPYISFEESENNDSFLEDEYVGNNFILQDKIKSYTIKKSRSADNFNNSTFDDSKENLLTEENLKKLSNNSSDEKLHLIEEFLGHNATYDKKDYHSDLAGNLHNTDEL